jgi:hypothetical protein
MAAVNRMSPRELFFDGIPCIEQTRRVRDKRLSGVAKADPNR